MIISVSRRTDIPAFYSEWFFNRIKAGFVDVVNPMNPNQISRIDITPNKVDCFVFWTKDATPMMNRLDELSEYKYYFQYTITPYNKDAEPGLLNKKKIIENFKDLSKKIGKDKIIFRYDPIFLTKKYSIKYHCEAFEKLCRELNGFTEKCVISFIDLYKKTEKNTKSLNIIPMNITHIEKIAKEFSLISSKYGIKIETCAENYNLEQYGISSGKCIDDKLISEILNCNLNVKKDRDQREICGCVKSIDIGQYNTCKHHCLYCYANFNYKQVEERCLKHNPQSSLLIGELNVDSKISIKKMSSIKINENKQSSLF